jgi:uncharacterized membrane protein
MNSEIRFLAQQLLHAGLGPLPERDRRVIARVARRLQTRNLNQEFEEHLTFGQKLADRVAVIGGSWTFIIAFSLLLVTWALINSVVLASHAFDPFPYIFLNLMLSMLAALQAPVIMMSQNRQAAKDRMAAALDYEVNLKAELAIAELHIKLDRLQASLEDRDSKTAGGCEEAVPPTAPIDVERELVGA